LKWLALCLFTYVIVAFIARPHWSAVLRATFVPSWPKDHDTWENLVAILGTTISPYLFFWQSSQEVEQEKAKGRRMLVQREGATPRELINRKLDVGTGTFFSNFVMYFIILAAAATLHTHGVTRIETSKQAAEALKPLAGNLAYFGSHNGRLYAVDLRSGQAAWTFQTEGAKRDPLKLVNADGSLNQESFSPVFGDFQDMYVDFYRYISTGAILGSPAVVDGVLYVGSTDGNVYALE